MSKYSVQKPYTVLVAVILVLVLGFVSFTGMQTELLPNISLPYLMVMTVYPGASPEKVENAVTEPLEASLGRVNGVENVTSTSSENYSMVMLEFAEETNMDSAMVKVSSQIDQLADTLPDICSTPVIMEVSMDMMATMYLSVDCEGMDVYDLSDFVDETVQPYIERQAGVASVSATGMVEKTVEVRLDQEKINAVNDKLLVKVNSKLADAKRELDKAQKEVDDGLAKLEEGSSQLEKGQNELNKQQGEIGDALGDTIGTVKQTIPQMAASLRQMASQMDTQVKESEKVLASVEAERDQQKQNLEAKRAELGLSPEEEVAQVAQSNQCFQKYAPLAEDEEDKTPQTKEEALANNSERLLWLNGKLLEAEVNIETRLAELPTEDAELTEEQKSEKAALEADKGYLVDTLEVTALWTGDDLLLKTNQKIGEIKDGIAKARKSAEELRTQANQLETTGQLDESLGDMAAQILLSGTQAQLGLGRHEMNVAKTQLESAKAQLKDAKEQYNTAREEALKSANLDQLLNMSTISSIIMAQNFSMPAGYVSQGEDQYLIKVGDAYETVQGVENTLLCSMDGIGDVRIGDVAQVTLLDNAGESYAKVNGNTAVVLSVFKASTSGTSEVSKNCQAAIKELEERYPGLRITLLMNQGDYITMVVDSVLSSLVQGAMLAILVLIIFLKDFRPTAVVAISIPLSVLAAIVVMYFTGINLNIISLGGLSWGIGMLVDNSIVVIENIYRLRSRGISAARAAVQGAKQVTGAIAASTLTTVCVFLPLVFSTGITRELLQDMALTIGYSLLASLVVALTVVPAMSATLLKNCKEKQHPWFDKITQVYGKTLRFCLRYKIVPLAISFALLIFSIWKITQIGMVMIPEMNSNQITVNAVMPEENTDQQSVETADALMERLVSVDGIEIVGMMASSSANSLMGGMGGSSKADFSSFSCFITLSDEAAEKPHEMNDAIMAATADLNCEVTVSSAMDFSSMMASGLQIDIYGRDLDKLLTISEDLMKILGQVEGFEEISNGQEDGDPEIRVSINKDEAMKLGLTVAQVYSKLSAALTTSTTSTSLTVGEDEISVEIVDETKEITLDNLMDYEFQTSTMDDEGKTVTETHKLREFATRSEGKGVASIRRTNQARTMSVTAVTKEGYNTTLLSRQVEKLLEDYPLPDGYTIDMGGESSMVNEMVFQMGKMIALALVFVYLVMVAQFQSLLSPFIVIFTIPLAFTGGLLGIWLSGELISLMSLMGFLLLAGVVVNNGIVYVDYTNQLRIAGMGKQDALVATGITRMRPIFMTALTTVLSMSVMAFSNDPTAAMSRGMAIVVIGGLLYATLMTLFIVPVMYDIFFRRKDMTVVDVGDDLEDEMDEAAEFARMLGTQESNSAQNADESEFEQNMEISVQIEENEQE